ncbi:MAG: flavodoxin domain-containing protein [Deferribacteres bacterium]|nr:flavodoxin domain-containing protein [candidate division KSB1 bacterium]MCB9503946.1 flavodoxin domain-containing protein [Deferribacteres bacterium]
MKRTTRREFIKKLITATGGAIGIAAIGSDFLVPSSAYAQDIKFPEANCGEKSTAQQKILITYASQFGTTGEIAKAMGEAMCQEGAIIETKWIQNVIDLQSYDAVVIGSAIHYDGWMSEAEEFVKTNQNILSKVPVAYFFSCLTLSKQNEKARRKAQTYADKIANLVPKVKPVLVGQFAGVLDYGKMSFLTRTFAKGIMKIMQVKEGDYRNWNAIQTWAKDVHYELSARRA